jgi:hypothetical protein
LADAVPAGMTSIRGSVSGETDFARSKDMISPGRGRKWSTNRNTPATITAMIVITMITFTSEMNKSLDLLLLALGITNCSVMGKLSYGYAAEGARPGTQDCTAVDDHIRDRNVVRFFATSQPAN